MGYFDGLTSGSFKTAQDGRRLFYPWGYLGRGYVLASDDEAERLRRQLKTYYIVMLVAIVATSGLHAFVTSAAVAGVCIIFYAIWATRQVAKLQPAGEAMSFGESSAAQARSFGPRALWLLEICSLVFVAGGIFMYAADPANRLMALFTIIFFGCCAVAIGYLLVIRRRTSAAP
jgi:hypothetical protein